MKKAVSRAVGLILAAVMAAAMMGCSSPKAEEGAQPGNTESDAPARENTGSEIGRASCRERVSA